MPPAPPPTLPGRTEGSGSRRAHAALTCQQLLQALAEGLQLPFVHQSLGPQEFGDEAHGRGDLTYHAGPGVQGGMHGGGGGRQPALRGGRRWGGTGCWASGAGRDRGGAALTGCGADGGAQITSRGRQPPPPLPTAGGRQQQRRPRQRSPHFLRRGAKGATCPPPLLIAATDRKWRHSTGGASPPIRRSHHRDGRRRGGASWGG